MLFVLRAAFWTAVVAAFVPQYQPTAETSPTAWQGPPVFDGEAAQAAFCADYQLVCTVTREGVGLARGAARLAAEATLSALDATDTSRRGEREA